MAPPRRIIRGFNRPVDPLQGGKAGNNDPRRFISGNIPGQQWDERQFQISRAELERGQPPQYSQVHTDRATPDVTARTSPLKFNFVPWNGIQPVANTPTLVVPRNPNRVDLLFTVIDSAVNGLYFSFGFPVKNGLGNPAGLPLPAGIMSPRFAGACPINDLYMWTSFAGSVFLVFEGVEALEANLG